MEPKSLGTTVTAGQQLENTSSAPEMPDWLVTPDTDLPDLPKKRQATLTNREIMYMQFEYMFDHVLEEIAEGNTIKRTLDKDARGYKSSAYIDWIKKDPQRTSRYENAQLLYAEALVAEIIEIADAADSIEDVNRSKERISSRKWVAGVYNKRRYGETKTIEMGGSISITDALAQARARVLEAEVIDVSDVTPKLENE